MVVYLVGWGSLTYWTRVFIVAICRPDRLTGTLAVSVPGGLPAIVPTSEYGVPRIFSICERAACSASDRSRESLWLPTDEVRTPPRDVETTSRSVIAMTASIRPKPASDRSNARRRVRPVGQILCSRIVISSLTIDRCRSAAPPTQYLRHFLRSHPRKGDQG